MTLTFALVFLVSFALVAALAMWFPATWSQHKKNQAVRKETGQSWRDYP